MDSEIWHWLFGVKFSNWGKNRGRGGWLGRASIPLIHCSHRSPPACSLHAPDHCMHPSAISRRLRPFAAAAVRGRMPPRPTRSCRLMPPPPYEATRRHVQPALTGTVASASWAVGKRIGYYSAQTGDPVFNFFFSYLFVMFCCWNVHGTNHIDSILYHKVNSKC